MSCPEPVELERVYWATLDPAHAAERDLEVREHVDGCATCRPQWTEIVAFVDVGRTIQPAGAWNRSEEIRTTLVSEVKRAAPPAPRRLHWLWPAVAGAAVAAAVMLLAGSPGSPAAPGASTGAPDVRKGTVFDHGAGKYTVASAQPDEIVRLVDGNVTVAVAELAAGERFRVITGDAELDGANATFDVSAAGDKLTSVRVMRGAVKVLASGGPQMIRAGETWRAPITAAAEPPPADALAIAKPLLEPEQPYAPAHVPRPVAREQVAAEPSPVPGRAKETASPAPVAVEPVDAAVPLTALPPPPRSMAQQAFDDGWAALREGRFAEAATAFDRVATVTTDTRAIEDATFWRGVALARAGEIVKAEHVLTAFLAAYPASTRTGEAHVMLGWLLFERRDRDAAKRHFEAAAADASARVRAAAANGLSALAKLR